MRLPIYQLKNNGRTNEQYSALQGIDWFWNYLGGSAGTRTFKSNKMYISYLRMQISCRWQTGELVTICVEMARFENCFKDMQLSFRQKYSRAKTIKNFYCTNMRDQNRLIGEQQPDAKRKVTYTSIPFYRATSELLPSGLLRPVRLCLTTLIGGAQDNRCWSLRLILVERVSAHKKEFSFAITIRGNWIRTQVKNGKPNKWIGFVKICPLNAKQPLPVWFYFHLTITPRVILRQHV